MLKRVLGKLAPIFAASCLLISNNLTAEWTPEILEEDFSGSMSDLEAKDYITLKNFVKKELKGSWCSEEKIDLLMDLVLLTKPKVCVEIGAFTGSSVLPVGAALKYNKAGVIYAIDAWSAAEAIRGLEDGVNKDWWGSLNMSQVHKQFKMNVKKWGIASYCKELHMPSSLALKQLPEIDFLHIDGNFSEEGALQDVKDYLPKVKAGGYVLLSNVFLMINGKAPKLTSYCELSDECEMIGDVDKENVILFRKK